MTVQPQNVPLPGSHRTAVLGLESRLARPTPTSGSK